MPAYRTDLKCRECGSVAFNIGVKSGTYPTIAPYVEMYAITCARCAKTSKLDTDNIVRFTAQQHVEVA